jgi:hypothetical protein
MEIICQLQASTSVTREKEPAIDIDLEAGWAPQPVCTFYRRERHLVLCVCVCVCVCEFNLILPGGKDKRLFRCLINKHSMKPRRGNGGSDPLTLNFRSRCW